MTPDVLLLDRIAHTEGAAFTRKTMRERGVGGSEIELMQVAHGLADRGHKVVVANGVHRPIEEDGVLYVPNTDIEPYKPSRALFLMRMSHPTKPLAIDTKVRIVVRANDVYCPPYDVHRRMLETGSAALVANTRWGADLFGFAKEKIVISPMLDPSPHAIWSSRKGFANAKGNGKLPGAEASDSVYKIPGLFVFVSGPMKGLGATLAVWRKLHKLHGKLLKKAKLSIVSPGWGEFPAIDQSDKLIGVRFEGVPTPEKYREWIAKAEGLFFVNTMPETFCNAAALSERSGTRTHILCKAGFGGIPEALVNHTLLTEDEDQFIAQFMDAWQSAENRDRWYAKEVPDRSPAAVIPLWEEALRLRPGVPSVSTFKHPARAGTRVELYDVPPGPAVPPQEWAGGGRAQRYWVHDRVLSGGCIVDDRCVSVLKDQGITHVLSWESEHLDDGKWPDDKRARFPFMDNGGEIPLEVVLESAKYIRSVFEDPEAVLYTHCQLGGSRGPSAAYLACRILGLDPAQAMAAVRATREDGWAPHRNYINSIEQGLKIEARNLVTSVEQNFPDDPTLAANKQPLGSFFGEFLSEMRSAISPGGSEFGLGLSLFSLAASIRASHIVEIGRFKGFSTLALAGACRLQDVGWKECRAGEQRPDVNYQALLGPRKYKVTSIDPHPTKEADVLLERTGLASYVTKINQPSEDVTISQPIDLLFIDGSHMPKDIRLDVQRFVPWVRPGGYFVMHDYFGWFTSTGHNGSPVAQIIEEMLDGFDRVLVDTGFASFVIFRRTEKLTQPKDLTLKLGRVAAREDGRPTVGLLVICRGDEAATVIARAIVSAHKIVDCTTVVCDASEKTAEVARHLGAEVFIRQSPKVDWERGIGVIAGARNEAIALAEMRTDYVLVIDADDSVEGTLPDKLEADGYEVWITDGNLTYPRIQLFRSGMGYHYEGIRHEGLVIQGRLERLTMLTYHRGHSSYGFQDQDPPAVKYMKHAIDLQQWLLRHPDDGRAAFYLARSYHDAGKWEEAVRAYERRIEIAGGWEEERYYSAFQIGMLRKEHGQDPTQDLLRAHSMRPTRAEPLVELACWHRDDARKQYSLAYMFARRAAELPMPSDGLFLNKFIYTSGALAEMAICAYWAGYREDSVRLFEDVARRAPDRARWAESMAEMCRREISNSRRA